MHARFGHQEAALNVLNEAIMMAQEGTQCFKIGKKVQFQKCKKTLFAFSKMAKKSIFALENSLKPTKMHFLA